MNRFTIIILSALMLYSCESQENKTSRITLDNYARKFNSMTIDIIASRDEEGSQSRLTLNRFYDRYTSKYEDFNSDLDFETISEKYNHNRENLITLSRLFYNYLNTRKSAIINMSDAMSAYKAALESEEDYNKYLNKMYTSSYSTDFYSEMALKSANKKLEKSIEFLVTKLEYNSDLHSMDSLLILIDSISTNYNIEIPNSKLIEEIKMPQNLNDTIDDWVISSKTQIEQLEIND